MSLFKIPSSVAKKIIFIQRWLLRSRDMNKQSICKVVWNFLARSKVGGILGIGSIMKKNQIKQWCLNGYSGTIMIFK
jgi:hypothetical protein